MFNIVILNSENELFLQEIKNECQKEKWIPAACLEQENNKTILFFNNIETTRDFIKRNFNKKDLVGVVLLSEEETIKIKNNYEFLELDWPKKINNIKFEIINLNCSLDLHVHS